MRMLRIVLFVLASLMLTPSVATAATPKGSYQSALAAERAMRARSYSVKQARTLVARYDAIARRYPASGYSDNALWQGAGLAMEVFKRTGLDRDRALALRLLNALVERYPSSSLRTSALRRIDELDRREAAGKAPARRAVPTAPLRADADPVAPMPVDGPAPASGVPDSILGLEDAAALAIERTSGAEARARAAAPRNEPGSRVMIRQVQRTPLPEGIRVILQLDAEVPHRMEELHGPRRLFFDFSGVQAAAPLVDATLSFEDGPVRQIRLGRPRPNTTRVVLDFERVARYSVFALYNPYRLVIDCLHDRPAPTTSGVLRPPPALAAAPVRAPMSAPLQPAPAPGRAADRLGVVATAAPAKDAPPEVVEEPALKPPPPDPEPDTRNAPLPSAATIPARVVVPRAPSANASGKFSLARQLGLGISRIVIDPGHGGHDPGAQGSRLRESELVLDLALKLEQLLLKQGFEVILTRRANVYVPLEERTAIANREQADLFLSIHANASHNTKASGIETYFLNFASSPDAEEVAARENSASGAAMRNLPDIVQAIALNNKLDESRDFAGLVQDSLVRKLRSQNKDARNLGVKRAPFVVLIGATMPSILAEVSFLTNRSEGALLRTAKYRQRIAEALADGVQRYRRALKTMTTAAR
jgi:N-acetylmuramoyl-L-alanine amidase